MKLGVIARCDDRGLGTQTWEVCRNLRPDKVLLVYPRPTPWPQFPKRYAEFDTTVVRWPRKDDSFDQHEIQAWLRGLDVVYTAETLYDWRIPQWFSGKVVCHANPEMMRPDRLETPGVTWWSATPWRKKYLPVATRVVPMPCPTDRFPAITSDRSGTTRFLHVVGHQAIEDRNGSHLFAKALRYVTGDCEVKVTSQDDVSPKFNGRMPIEKVGPVADYWDAYRNVDVLVMPRKFGGLCLPVVEALAAGLVVLMTDCSPNEVWPGPRVPPAHSYRFKVVGGLLDLHEVAPEALADAMDHLCEPGVLDAYRAEAHAWRDAHSWRALEPLWREELERA